MLLFQKDPRNVSARRFYFPAKRFRRATLFQAIFFFPPGTTHRLLEHWFFIRIFFPSLGWIFLFFSDFRLKILLWIPLDYSVWLGMYLVSAWCWSHFVVSLRVLKPNMTHRTYSRNVIRIKNTAGVVFCCFLACFTVERDEENLYGLAKNI